MRVIALVFTGGTISMRFDAAAGGAVPALAAHEILAAARGIEEVAHIRVEEFGRYPGPHMTVEREWMLRNRLAELVADPGIDGVVVTHGTDTIEESAYLIDLLWDDERPVVVTGAMRNPTLAGADGPANLLAAVTVAADERMRGLGVLVVLDDQIHAARFARKTHTTATGAFSSPNAGPLGRLTEGEPTLATRVERRATYPLTRPVTARVPVLAVGLDDTGDLLAGLAAGCDGLIVAGLGGGHVPPALAEQLGELAERVPVVLASRTGAGSVLTHTYGYVGSESDLLRRGLIASGPLDAYKARVLLRVLLAAGLDRAAIAGAFATAG